MKPLLISEMFGPTVQGEGRSTGTPALFVRFGLCNLDCSWCDTPFTWDWKGKNGVAYDRDVELSHHTVESVVGWTLDFDTNLVVISGGEPLVQGQQLALLVERLLENGKSVEIETNGTISPHVHLSDEATEVRWNVSPKVDCSNVNAERALKLETLKEYADLPHSIFKFVVQDFDDIETIEAVVDATGITNDRVWLMPEGRTSQEICERLPFVISRALEHNYQVTTRLHVHAYGDRRGV